MVAFDLHLRKRVERFLSDAFNPEDLAVIYKGLRFKSYGIASVKELGDFEAHSDYKNKGLITDECKDFFSVFKFMYSHIGENFDFDHPSLHFKRAMITSLRRISETELKQATGLGRKQAGKTLKGTLDKYIREGDKYNCPTGINDLELRVLTELSSNLVVRPAFSQHDLTRDLNYVLLKNDLITRSQKSELVRHSDRIALYAICLMHRTGKVELEHNETADLCAGLNEDNNICVQASSDCFRPDGEGVNLSITIFSTTCSANDYLGEDLHSQFFAENGKKEDFRARYYGFPNQPALVNTSPNIRLRADPYEITCPIELLPNGKIYKL